MPETQIVNAATGLAFEAIKLPEENYNWLMDEFETFSRHKGLERAIIKSSDLLESGDYGPVEKLIKDAVQVGLTKDMGTDYFADPRARLLKIKDNNGQVSTGWPTMDKRLFGGMNRGELNIFAGGSGAGKSLFLANLGVNWALAGLNVLYLTLELSEELEDFINEAIEAGLSEEEILEAIDENFEFISEEEELEEETSEIAEELENYEVDMHEHVNALLAGENLSEDFHAKATTIFEAAVKAKLEEEVALLEQAYAETLEERVEEIMEELASNVDDYLNYVVEQWIAENEVAVESALRSELTEDFISGLRSLFAEHYIDIPEESVPVVEELSSTVEELEAKLNEEIQRNVELTGMLAESRKFELTAVVCEGLTDVQAAKLQALAENVAYTSDEEFIEKVATLRESYFPSGRVDNSKVLDTNPTDSKGIISEEVQGPMAAYVKALGKTLPK